MSPISLDFRKVAGSQKPLQWTQHIKTNNHKIPLIIVVAVSNLDTKSLHNLLVAFVIAINEKRESYEWALQVMRETIWPEGDTGKFVTDNDWMMGSP